MAAPAQRLYGLPTRVRRNGDSDLAVEDERGPWRAWLDGQPSDQLPLFGA
ncbi:hypothetical protein ABZU94_32265 [Streptomyces mirabilis]